MEEHKPASTPEHAPMPAQKNTKDNISIPLAIVFSGILIAGAILFTEKSAVPLAPSEQIPARQQVGADTESAPIAILTLREDDHILGNPKADVVIIEYSDAQCPFCQRFHETMIKIMNDYAKTGSVAWVYRHFPLDQIHPHARKAAEAMECANELAGNEGFWKFTDQLFSAESSSINPDALPVFAKATGLDVAKFTACMTSGKYAARVQKDFEDGAEIGVRGTPYSIIWNRKTGKQMPINGALPYENVKTILGLVSASQDTKQ